MLSEEAKHALRGRYILVPKHLARRLGYRTEESKVESSNTQISHNDSPYQR